METLVVNMFAGPGAGKSTTASSVFALLKLHGINCELITEFAKDLTWEHRNKTLENQNYIMAKQHHRMWRLKKQVDVMITDSPLIFFLIYGNNLPECVINSLFHYANDGFHNINYFIQRVKDYNPKGRNQTKEEALELDTKIINMLNDYSIEYKVVIGDFIAANSITQNILDIFNKRQQFFISPKYES